MRLAGETCGETSERRKGDPMSEAVLLEVRELVEGVRTQVWLEESRDVSLEGSVFANVDLGLEDAVIVVEGGVFALGGVVCTAMMGTVVDWAD